MCEIKLAPIVTLLLINQKNKKCISPRISGIEKGYKKTVVTNGEALNYDNFYIEPIIDDRMFVACVYNVPKAAKEICAWDAEQKQYRYISDATEMELTEDNIAQRFYKMVFVDGNGLTCQNRTKLREMNEEHSFARWIEYDTILGISEYSMVCITKDEEDVFNINPFLTEYIEMGILVLAQRASLLAFERSISEVTCNKKSKLSVEGIHRRYVAFESELLLTEVTSQQQGIEIYDMMLKNLFIDKLKNDMLEQIDSLYDLDTAGHERKENFLLNLLATFCAAGEIGEILGNLLDGSGWPIKGICVPLIEIGLGVVFFALLNIIPKKISHIKRKF